MLYKYHSGKAVFIKSAMLFFLVAITFSPMLYTGFLTRDDAERHLEVLNGGILGGVWGIAEANGRLTLAFHILLTHVPYLSDDFVYRKSFLILSHVLTTSYFAYVLGKYLHSKTVASVFLVLFMVFLTNSWEHNLYASYPFAFHASMVAVIGSAHFMHSYRITGKRSYLVPSAISYGLAMGAYEQFTVYALFLLGVLFFWQTPVATGRLRQFLKLSVPFFIVIAIYLLLVIAFKIMVPGKYVGTEFARFDIVAFFVTLKTFILSSLPVYVPIGYAQRIEANVPDYKLSLAGIVDSFRLLWAMKALVAAALITWSLKSPDYQSNRATLVKHTGSILLLLFLSVLLVSASAKYQDWVTNHGALAYSSPTYFAQLLAAAFVAVIVCAVGGVGIVSKLRPGALFVGVALLLIPVVAVIEHHNNNVLAEQRDSANKWHAIESMSVSGVLRAIPAGSIIYAPKFMQTGGIASMREGYWGAYLRAKHGINVEVTGDYNKYLSSEYFGKRYIINYHSIQPYEFYHANISQDISPVRAVEIPNNESTGFYGEEKDAAGVIFRWSKKASSLSLCNGSNVALHLDFMAKVRCDGLRPEPLRVCMLGECRDYRLSSEATLIREKRVFQPGCTTVTFDTAARPVHAPLDPRTLHFQLFDIMFEN